MPISKHYYKNDNITVIWQPSLCQHSGICFKGLPQVFDPRRRPWIEMDESDSESITEQVKKCPSGALSYVIDGEAGKAL